MDRMNDYTGLVFINFNVSYGEETRSFKVCVKALEATETMVFVLSLIPQDNMTALLVDKSIPTIECTLDTKESIEAIVNKAFGRTNTLTLEKGEKPC